MNKSTKNSLNMNESKVNTSLLNKTTISRASALIPAISMLFKGTAFAEEAAINSGDTSWILVATA
ncbi:MAG: hypothetical protein AB7U45_12720, partial [Desulfamplus sp.]